MAGTFLERIENYCGAEMRREAAKVLEAMDLPDPQQGEYLCGTEATMLFLDRYGLILRVGEEADVPDHDLILHPLKAVTSKSKHGYTQSISLLPGVEGLVRSEDDVDRLAAKLREDGISFWDQQINNCGYVRARLPGFENGVPVVVDRGSVGKQSYPPKSKSPLAAAFNSAVLAGFQEKFFGPFIDKLKTAWPTGAATPDKAGMKAFLRKCARDIRKKSHATLCNQWNKNLHKDAYEDCKPNAVTAAAALYEMSLKARDAARRADHAAAGLPVFKSAAPANDPGPVFMPMMAAKV